MFMSDVCISSVVERLVSIFILSRTDGNHFVLGGRRIHPIALFYTNIFICAPFQDEMYECLSINRPSPLSHIDVLCITPHFHSNH